MHKMSKPTDRTESIWAEWINIYSYRLSLTLIQSLSFRNGKCITPSQVAERLFEYFLTQIRLDFMCALAPKPKRNHFSRFNCIHRINLMSTHLIPTHLNCNCKTELSNTERSFQSDISRFLMIFLDFPFVEINAVLSEREKKMAFNLF